MITDPLTDRHNNISECRCPAADNRTTSNDERSMMPFRGVSPLLLVVAFAHYD